MYVLAQKLKSNKLIYVKHVFFLILALCSADEIRTAECSVSCKYLGYASGQYNKDNCYCYDVKSYDSIVKDKKVTFLPRNNKKPIKKYTWEN